MADPVALGLPNITLEPGDHLCIFYRGSDQRDAVLLPYLREGMAAGDKCICVVDAADPDRILGLLEREPAAVATATGRCLEVMTSDESYLRDGGFETEAMLAFWEAGMRTAMDDGFPFVRAAGEMTWALRDVPGVDRLIPYEAELNRNLGEFPQVILCFYDLERFSNGQLLLDVMRTHPKVLLGGTVVDNPWYLEPEEFLASMS